MKKLMLITLISGCILEASTSDETPLKLPTAENCKKRAREEYAALQKKYFKLQNEIDDVFAFGAQVEKNDKDYTTPESVWYGLCDELSLLILKEQHVKQELLLTKRELELWDKLCDHVTEAKKMAAKYALTIRNSHICTSTTTLESKDASPTATTTVATKSTSTEKSTSDTYQALRIFCLTVVAYISLSALMSQS